MRRKKVCDNVISLCVYLITFCDNSQKVTQFESQRVIILVRRMHPQQDGKIFFGAWVELQNDDDEILKFRIVGPDEIYKRNDYISFNSPIASACLKKSVDDEIVVKTPSGEAVWYVNSIDYTLE